MAGKSEGLLQFERGIADLRERIKRGEFPDPLYPSREYNRLLRDSLPKMTAAEQEAIQLTRLKTHQLGAEMFSELGHPVPGSDPKKPN